MTRNHSNDYLSSDEVLKISLLKFFQKKDHIEKFLPILIRTASISLRLLDYFCVTYCKQHSVSYTISDKYFDVYSSYKNQLNTYSKKKFDPFKRNNRIPLVYNGKRYYTTIAQLCFFKWCFTYKVIEYVEKHKSEINEEMKSYSSNKSICSSTSGSTSGSTHQTQSSNGSKLSRKKHSTIFVATRVYTNNINQDTIVISFD